MSQLVLSIILAIPFLGNSQWAALSDTAISALPIMKTEVAQSGNNLYTIWFENTNDENNRVMRFRKSGDNGRTWDETMYVDQQSSWCTQKRVNQMMAVSGNNVYLLSQLHKTSLYIFRSLDEGKTFQKTVIDNVVDQQDSYVAYFIQAEGNDVVVAYQKEGYDAEGIYVAISHDAGATFRDTLVNADNKGADLYALTYSGNRWCVLYHDYSWYVGLTWGKAFVTSGIELEFTTKKVSPVTDSGKDMCNFSTTGSVNYHPIMCQEGDTIHVVMEAQVVDSIPRKTVYRRSEDGGQTWSEPVILPSKVENTNMKQVIARNGHIYITDINTSGRVGLHVSHDNGVSWTHHDELTDANGGTQYWGGTEDYSIQFDPNDKSGLSVYLVATRLMWLYTRDGFRTISAANSFGWYLADTNGSNTIGHILVDEQGKRHFLVRTIPDRNHSSNSILYYHSEGGEPQASGEMAFHVSKKQGYDDKALVTITPENELRVDSAITVSLWIKIDSVSGNHDLAWHNVQTTQKATNYDLGWAMRIKTSGKYWYYEAALATDKSDDRKTLCLYNSSSWSVIRPGIWHNLTFTYDAQKGGNNFFSYMDGILMDEGALTGKLEWGFTPICIGLGNAQGFASIQYDDFRIWNCALTAEEVAQMPFKETRKSNEVIHLDFNNTLADASGHGHNAVPLFGVDYKSHVADVPHADFNAIVEGKRLSAIDKTINGIVAKWSFGDTYTDTLRYPQHEYYKVGDYPIQMIANNNTTAWGCEKTISIAGLERMEPRNAGNGGYFYPTIYGGGLTKYISQIFLAKGNILIPCDSLLSYENSKMKVRFNVEAADLGFWDLIVNKDTLRSAVYIDHVDNKFLPDISITGREKLLKNKWQTYTLTCSNRNNTAMYQVPVYIFIQDSKDLEVEFINFAMAEPIIENMPEEYDHQLRDSIGEYALCKIKTRNSKDSISARLYPIILPILEGNSSEELRIRVRANDDVCVLGAISDGLLGEQGAYRISYEQWMALHTYRAVKAPARYIRRVEMDEMVSKGQCVLEYLGRGVITAAGGTIAGLDCIIGAGFNVYDLYNDIKNNNKKVVSNALWNFGGTAVSCAASLLGPVIGFVVGGVSSMICNYHTVKDCLGDNNTTEKNVRSVSSLDPNEMVGPTGAGEEHWLKPDGDMDYTIFFENKSTATAPAHTITISDTLDINTLDLSTFSFTTFAWGDTTFTIEGNNVREFTRDVDLRPAKELIVRVSGKLDTISGIVDWAILSLNPITREEEEDPDLGVLPPNDEKGSGEGYVGFRIEQKKKLASGSYIRNEATIIFDTNEPIATNEFINRIDAAEPVSSVASVEAVGDSLLLTFSGIDSESGIASYEVWAQINDTLTGILDASYSENTMTLPLIAPKMGFWIVATDNVGWRESKESAIEAVYEAPTGITTPNINIGTPILKVLENGQIVIIQGENRFSILGTDIR